jgi:YD repeat-containing protein
MKVSLFTGLLPVLLVVANTVASAQSGVSQLMKPIPPSPTTREFEKYIDHKVSIYNGIPEINIPLYEVKVDGLTIPLALSYHASGIKYKQTNGDVGVGWVLNPGYRVSRTIYGRHDERYDMPNIQAPESFSSPADRDKYLSRFGMPSDGGYGHLPSPSGPLADAEFDIFKYSLPDRSGSFVIKDRQNKTVAILDGDRSRIGYQVVNNGYVNIIDYFDVTDSQGMKYRFGKSYTGETEGRESGPSAEGFMAWALMDIVTPFNEHVFFKYESRMEQDIGTNETTTFQEAEGPFTYSSSCISEGFSSDPQLQFTYRVPFLKEIMTSKEKITIIRPAQTTTVPPFDNKIQAIEIRDNNNALIKRISFTYSNTTANVNYTYWYLDKVSITGKNSSEQPEEFGFDYHRLTNSTGVEYTFDYWGYTYAYSSSSSVGLPSTLGDHIVAVKGTNCLPSGVPVRNVSNGPTFATKQIVNAPTYNILNKIVYPTKGYTLYSYESNQYLASSGAVEKGGGLRVSEIRSYNYDANINLPSLRRTYKYGTAENGIGITPFAFNPRNFVNERIIYRIVEGGYYVRTRNIDYSTTQSSEAFADAVARGAVYYPEVNVYHGGATSNNGRERYLYQTGWGNDYEYFRTNTSMKLGGSRSGERTLMRTYSQAIIRSHDAYSGAPNLLSHEIYDMNKNIIRRDTFSYRTTIREELKGLKVKPFFYDGEGTTSLNYYQSFNLQSFYDYSPYSIHAGFTHMSEKTTTHFVNNVPTLSVVTKYEHNAHNQLTRETITGSRSNAHVTRYSYPSDYTGLTASDPTTAGVKKLLELNILDPVIEKTMWRQDNQGNSQLISSQFNTFNPVKPLQESVLATEEQTPVSDFEVAFVEAGALTKDNRYRSQIAFEKYDDKGNILQQRKANDGSISYVWDYQNNYPVAEILNAEVSDVAYSGFEADGKGNWEFSTPPVADATAFTGNKVYKLTTGNSIVKSQMDNNKVYILSYWYKNPCVTVTGGTQSEVFISPITRNGWTYTQRKITGTQSIVIQGSDCLIDDLRLYPQHARMTTYTYDPVIGSVTSATDNSGKTVYYEYDGLGRLSVIKNHNKDVVKKYSYRFKE